MRTWSMLEGRNYLSATSSRRDGSPSARITSRAAGIAVAAALGSLVACTDKTDDDYRADVVAAVHDSIDADLAEIVRAANNLQTMAPTHAWTDKDERAIEEMRSSWRAARTAWEHVEGAIISMFPTADMDLDGRYEEMLTLNGATGDQDLFDGRGFTGMHAIERVLFAPTIRAEVVDFERTLPGYKPASYPASIAEAISFKTVLVQLFVEHAISLRKRWQPTAVNAGAAYVGLIGLMNEQKEKVSLAVTGEEESRYANATLFDLRNNVEGTQKMYGMFREWILTKTKGPRRDSLVQRRLGELATLYGTMESDALPAAPQDWSAEPTEANLATPFGTLWKTVHESVDPTSYGSVVFEMNKIAASLGFPEFVER